MTYGILGPLLPAVTAGRDRIVLAMLLLHTDRVVSVGELVEAVWGDDPPSTARAQLQACVSRLRRVLPDFAIGTDPAGYRLRVGAGELDYLVFARLIARARAEGDAGLFREALDLWRGAALVGIDSRPVCMAAAALDEQYAAAVEDWAELELAAGHDRELIGALSEPVERFPLRERLRGQLIRALAGAGRAADALAEFRRAREVLRDELGIEPGPDLQELHRRILNAAEVAPVRNLPRTVGDFTGRDDAVRRLLRMIEGGGHWSPVIALLDGMAGSGKTTLALHVASLVGDRYPDAHLFVDLSGYGEREPVEPSAALLILLRQLGIPAKAVPADLDGRVTMWRSELSRRRVLVVLDNAYSSVQLADLLPTSPGTLALVTSRRRLAGVDGAYPESLPVLALDEAMALLARIAGDRVRAEPEATAEVVRRCGGLPLALRLAGARLAHRPRWRVADLVRRLGESALPELSAEDRSVGSAFALSYGQLADGAKRMFRLLGLYPAPRFDAPAAAALAGLPLDDAQDLLDDLIDVHLLDEPEPGIFRPHELLREFAATLAADLPADERRRAIGEVLDLQVHAFAASNPPARRIAFDVDLGRPTPRRPDLVAAVADPLARLEWERPQLSSYVEAAAGAGFVTYAWWIPRAAWWYLFSRSYGDDIGTLCRLGLAVVEKAGDRRGVGVLANYLASAYMRMNVFPPALDLLERSVRVHEELGDLSAVAKALGNRAGVYAALGRFAECVASGRASLRLRALAGDRTTSRVQHHNLAEGYLRLGRYEDSLRSGRLSLLAAIDNKDPGAESVALTHIQRAKRALGIGGHRQRQLFNAVMLQATRADHLGSLADGRNEQAITLRDEGGHAEAIRQHEAAIAITRRYHDRLHEALYLTDLARTRQIAGDPAGALEDFRLALSIADGLGARYVSARSLAGIAACTADPVEAGRWREVASAAFREMGVPPWGLPDDGARW
ncbi:AfsR/SARP family transcriptional regulator [Paractinoplanes globisporus]|uniref:BTAD domain-containing putative transcriptional regulator n=1 Tax=Paractinoplanes globisporus TaxID=113565 RepID=A0ABW6WQF6_9ACTN|nr:AfsR/SARP family transcriptional regulator [Actinoplanes globisporus]